jgi:hypothetical protein
LSSRGFLAVVGAAFFQCSGMSTGRYSEVTVAASPTDAAVIFTAR